MSKKQTLERAYFHINNGGLTFSVVERTDIRKDCIVYPPGWRKSLMKSTEKDAEVDSLPREDRHNRSWALKVETNHFGVSTQYSVPLYPVIVKWLVWSLQRVLAHMEAPQKLPEDGPLHFYEEAPSVRVTVQGGQQVDTYWPVPREPYESCGSSG